MSSYGNPCPTPRHEVFALTAFLFVLSISSFSVAQTDPAPLGGDENIYNFEIEKQDIAEALGLLSDSANLNVIISNKVKGEVNLYVKEMDPERALKETIEVNGYHYVQEGDVVWVLTAEEYYQDFNLGRARRIFHLSHARADFVQRTIQGTLSAHGTVLAYPETNVLLVAEIEDRIEEIEALIKELDAAPVTRVFSLEHASALELAPLLFSHVADPYAIQPDVRTNQIMVTETEENIARLEGIIKEFDKPDRIETRRYPLKYASAAETAEIVREILTGRRAAPGEGLGSYSRTQSRQESTIPTAKQPRTGGSASPVESFRQYRQAPSQATGAGQPEGTAPATTAGGQTTPAVSASEAVSTEEEAALGPLATVATDDRTNTVIITHTLGILNRLEKVIQELDVPGNYEVYQFQNVNPVDIDVETKLLGLLPGVNPYYNVDPVSGKVAFRAPPEQAEKVVEMLRQWDEPIPQVRIVGEILSVNSSLIEDLGISWQVLSNDFDVNVDFSSFADNASPLGSFGVGNLANDDWEGVVQALLTDGDTQVIATPKILVVDGQEGVFTSTRDEPYTVVVTDANTRTTLEDVRFLNLGVTLAVVPTINQLGLINIVVQLEISSLVEIRDGIPVADRSTAQSSVTVLNGGSVILGGLRQRERGETFNRVPMFSRLPLLGGLFKNVHTDNAEREIILILRPLIIGEMEPHIPVMPQMKHEIDQSMWERLLEEPIANPVLNH